MDKNQYLKQVFVDLVVKVDEILRFGNWTADNDSAIYKDLFRIRSFYYLFTFDRRGRERMRTLRQISKKEFFEEKQKLLRQRPRPGCENWKTNTGNSELKSYQNYNWKKKLPAENCTFFKGDRGNRDEQNPLLAVYNKAIKDAPLATTRQTPAVPQNFKEQINTALNLSRELGIAYENIRAIGSDKRVLLEFKESYEKALQNVSAMSPAERYTIYINLKPTNGRSARKKALEDLGIRFFGADVKRLNLSDLEALLSKLVEEYQKQSVKTAIATGIELPHNQREEMYNRMISTSREEKKRVLTELGVDIHAIELNKYSLSPIKHALAASIGIDLEKLS